MTTVFTTGQTGETFSSKTDFRRRAASIICIETVKNLSLVDVRGRVIARAILAIRFSAILATR